MTSQWDVDTTRGWLAPDVVDQAATAPCFDPYLVWADATGWVDLGGVPQGRFPIAIELAKSGKTAQELSLLIKTNGWEEWIWMSSLYRHPPEGLEQTRFCTAHVTREFFVHLHTDLFGLIERFTLGLPIVTGGPARTDQIVPDPAPLAPAQSRGDLGKVVIGVCDDGIAFAHQHFHEDREGRKTRVECFWNQDDASNSTAGLGYGRELLKSDIDSLMDAARRGDTVDEEAVYRQANYTAVARRWAHGTAVMDLACGVHPLRPPRPRQELEFARPMIGVQFRLPGRTMRDTSGLWLEVQALDAIRYIVARAHDIAGSDCHALVNLSYGYIAGPHDGSSMLECAMDELIDTGACSIIIPAGNSNLARCHRTRFIDSGKEDSMRWRVPPDCVTPGFVEIWLGTEQGDPQVQVKIEPPGGEASPWISLDNVAKLTRDGDTLCTVVHLGRGAKGDACMILVALAPTVTRDGKRKVAPPGNWIIWLKNTASPGLTVNAWVQRNETPDGFPLRGRQSRFDDDAYPRFDRFTAEQDYDGNTPSWIRRENTINSIATGRGPAVIGGWRQSDGATAPYSATGIDVVSAAPQRAGPDASAVSERSIVRAGVIAAGTRSGSAIPFEGTSAAAPQVVRMLAKGMPLPQTGTGLGQMVVQRPGSNLRDAVRKLAKRLNPAAKASQPIRFKTFSADEYARRLAERNVGAGHLPLQNDDD
ncbi:hypothetical protein M0D69_04140 [Caballeronia sp. SEWSISQ10-4 2]|uniref:hypothetical protein n=1 Tax=Caballeronia sp. SEWSISQ10-4 2 TaxID=2937438 RepID=UPI00264A8E1B|nr:hypothetical protein [Caballeronia sp. SEWSISQ10-4 2]MDN7177212.1 hypothetical protein [Caballeronia sp. SEWSISQ10-4 2]